MWVVLDYSPSIPFSADEKIYMGSHTTSMDNVGRDGREFFSIAFEGRLDGLFSKNSGLRLQLRPSKRLWAIVYGLLCALIQKTGLLKSHGVMPLV